MVAGAVSTVGSTVLGAAKGLASCMGTSNTNIATGNSMNPTVSIQNTNKVAATGGSLGKVGQVAGVAGALFMAAAGALHLYEKYDAKDDHRLFSKMAKEDCGGVSKMLDTIRGCYKQYASKAVHRAAVISPNPWAFYERLNQCFPESLTVAPCGVFGQNVFSQGE